jgi:hypothetical protein
MDWMDRLLKGASQTRALTGTSISDSAVSAAVSAGLESEYSRALNNANTERQVRTQKEIATQSDKLKRDAMSQQQSQFEDVQKSQADKELYGSIGNMATAAITNMDKLTGLYDKASGWVTGQKAVASKEGYVAGETAGASEVPGIANAIGQTEAVGSYAMSNLNAGATVAHEAVSSMGAVGNTAMHEFGLASSFAEGTMESTIATAVESSFAASQAALVGEGTAVLGESTALIADTALAAETTTIMGSLAPVMAAAPFVGALFLGIGFIFPGAMNKAFGAIGDAVSGLFDGSVVCTELNRQGYIPDEVLFLEGIARVWYIDNQTYNGYLNIFSPVVELMKKSKLITQIIRPFGVSVAYELASRVSTKYKPSLLGKFVLSIGLPLCKVFGEKRCLNGCY